MKTANLLFWTVIAYIIVLVLIRGVFPSTSTPTISLAGIPLIVIAVIIARDLSRRSTKPSKIQTVAAPRGPTEDPLQFMSGQIRVAATSSESYFDSLVRARLRDLLITKVALETGEEKEAIRRAMSDPEEARRLLHDERLYSAVYGPVPTVGGRRTQMISDAIDMIGEWKS